MCISIHGSTFDNNYSCKPFRSLLNTYLWAVSPFAAPLKLYQGGWKASVHMHLQISPKMFNSNLGHNHKTPEATFLDILTVCLESSSGWKMTSRPSLRSKALQFWPEFLQTRTERILAATFSVISCDTCGGATTVCTNCRFDVCCTCVNRGTAPGWFTWYLSDRFHFVHVDVSS